MLEKIRTLIERANLDWDKVLHVAEVGSTAHGISTPDTDDDYDFTVVRVETFEELVVGGYSQSQMIRTQPEGVRSGVGDIDLNVYTLRKFGALAAKGNPSILAAIFSSKVFRSSNIDLLQLGSLVASQRAGRAFLGYMQQQIDRWLGLRGRKNVSRPELVEAYGFDTKYAAHVIRLGYQGVEYMEWGRLSVPLGEDLAQYIIALRTGQIDERDALVEARRVEAELKEAIKTSRLPIHPAEGSVNNWLVAKYTKLIEENYASLIDISNYEA